MEVVRLPSPRKRSSRVRCIVKEFDTILVGLIAKDNGIELASLWQEMRDHPYFPILKMHIKDLAGDSDTRVIALDDYRFFIAPPHQLFARFWRGLWMNFKMKIHNKKKTDYSMSAILSRALEAWAGKNVAGLEAASLWYDIREHVHFHALAHHVRQSFVSGCFVVEAIDLVGVFCDNSREVIACWDDVWKSALLSDKEIKS